MSIMPFVVSFIVNKHTNEIVNISHKESAWLDNKDSRNIISYKKYAYNLQAFE